MAEPTPIRVTVVYSSAPRKVREWAVEVRQGATVRQALEACGLQANFPLTDIGSARVGVWGRTVVLEQPLRDRDRVEIYRQLNVDPKLARRRRFGQQGARATGLFAKKRAGAKPGY